VIVEATPPAGLPFQSTTAARHRQLWEYISGFVSEFRYRFAVGGWRWLATQLLAFLLTPTGILSLVAGVVALYVRWRILRRFDEPEVSEALAELQRLRKRMDHRVAKLGLNRHAGETLTHFAARIERESGDIAAARWYADYADLRYRVSQSPDDVASLRARAIALGRLPRRRRRSAEPLQSA
jgi:hypothetical protein